MAQQKSQEEAKGRKGTEAKEETQGARGAEQKGAGGPQEGELRRGESRRGEGTEMTRGREAGRGLARQRPYAVGWESPFRLMRQMSNELERLLEDIDVGWPRRGLLGEELLSRALPTAWVPPVEVVQRGDRLVIRAELPGLSRSDIEVDVQDGTVTLRGERRHESEEEERGVYRSERIYGTFSRTIPLPEGAEVEHAQATFHDGILEIDVPVTGAARGRRLEIKARSHEEAPGHPQGATQAGTQAGAQGGAHAGTQGTAQAGSHSAGSTAGK